MVLKLKVIICLGLIFALSSCFPLLPFGNPPKFKGCYFDPTTKSIINDWKDSGMMQYKILIFNKFDESKLDTIIQRSFKRRMNKIDLSKFDTALLYNNKVMIDIWYNVRIMEYCFVEIKPSDWKRKKRVYSRYNVY
jgi:hypothetical protein